MSTSRRTSRAPPRQALEERAVLGVDRQQRTPCSRAAWSSTPPPSRAFPCWRGRWCARPDRGQRARARGPTSAETTTSAATSVMRAASPGPPSSSGRAMADPAPDGPRPGPGARLPPADGRDQLGDCDVRAARGEPAHAELVRKGGDQPESPATDRSGRSEHGDRFHVLVAPQSRRRSNGGEVLAHASQCAPDK